MKKIIVLLITCCTVSFSFAQNKEVTAVAKAVEQLKQAMISGERSALESIASDSLSYGHSSGLVENKAAFVEHIASGQSDFVTIDLSEQTISINGNTAVVRHTFAATTNDGGKPGTVKLKILLVWQKEKGKGGWKLLARQAVKLS
jgi:ketosteroid isomerase-like protein